MHSQWIDGLSVGPLWEDSDFAAMGLCSLAFCSQPQNPILTISFAPVASVAKIFQHAGTSAKNLDGKFDLRRGFAAEIVIRFHTGER